jgi:PAS domain S-box-containing protein
MILEVLPNPVIVYDLQWNILKINVSAIQLFGYSEPAELIGKPILSILTAGERNTPESLGHELHKKKTDMRVQQINHRARDGKYIKLVSHFRMLDANRYIESGILLDGLLHQKEQRLKRMNCWKLLAENIPGLMMLLVNKDLEVQCSVGNELRKRQKHLVSDQTSSLLNRVPQYFVDILQPLLTIAFDGTSVSREFNYGNKFYSVRLSPIHNPQDGNLCVIILQNITETKIVENKLKLSKEEAEAANQAKSTFVAQMSHEIRTPLNAIIGFTEQLSKTKLTKKQSTYMEVVNNSSQHLLSIIDDILNLSKIEAGQIEVDEEPFKLTEVINAVRDVVELRQKKKNVVFQIHSDLPEEELLCGDAAKLRQVLINLLNNALKFTQRGTVSLNCSTLNSTAEKHTILFEVKDTGIGIAAENFENIFKPFQQGDASIGRSYFGSGLGLTISSNLVESMGGSISVKSRLGEGSTFSFSLTFNKPAKPFNHIRSNKSLLQPASLSHINVLFVDDDPANRLLGRVILSNYKIRGDFASSGDEAIELFSPGRYHLVFLDINMPGKSGIDVALHFRELERKGKNQCPSVIIAMTANVFKKHIERYIQAGMDDIILKPFKEGEFHEKIITHSFNIEDTLSYDPTTIPQTSGDSAFDLSELYRITRGNKEFVILMLKTFHENAEVLLQKIKKSLANNDYQSIAEAAHRLKPSFEQLGFRESTTSLLQAIESRYLNNASKRDPELIKSAIIKIEAGIAVIERVRNDMR